MIESELLHLIGRKQSIFEKDLLENKYEIAQAIKNSSILVIGGAGSIGMAVSKQLFSFNPKVLHIVDVSENNLVELVRDIRSSIGYSDGEFKTFVLDFKSQVFDTFLCTQKYDYVFNLAALKHVRSEKDPFTLMNMIDTNIIKTVGLHEKLSEMNAGKYFVVSSDKASAPANLMGASKLLMEHFLRISDNKVTFSSARFANVAFSDGSLLHGFRQRIAKRQPISAPTDISRYFVNSHEAGRLCLLSCFLGDHKNIFFPNIASNLSLISFSKIAKNFVTNAGLNYYLCDSEEEARQKSTEFYQKNTVPLYLFKTDTTGEKPFEEFVQQSDVIDIEKYKEIGIVLSDSNAGGYQFSEFLEDIQKVYKNKHFDKSYLSEIFEKHVVGFKHHEKNKYLDEKM